MRNRSSRFSPLSVTLAALFAVSALGVTSCSSSTSDSSGCDLCDDSGNPALDSGTSGLDGSSDDGAKEDASGDARADATSGDATSGDSPGTDAIATDATSDASGDATATGDYTGDGPFAVTKTDATVSGNAVHVLSPATPAGTLRSAVVFAHGFQLKTTDYDTLLSRIASWGYVVVSTDYPGSFFSIDHRNARDAIIHAKDALLAGTIAGIPKVDPAKIAAAGHSLGGKAAVMAVLADAAFASLVVFDPVDGNPSGTPDDAHPTLIPTEVAKLVIPVGYFGATQSRCVKSAFGPACAPVGSDAAAFFGATPTTIPRTLWTVFDFGHMQFLDGSCGLVCTACVDGAGDVPTRHVAIEAIAVAFLQRNLDGITAAQTWLDGAKRDGYVTANILWDGVKAKPACP